MTDPITVATIAGLAFTKIIETGAGEVAKKYTGVALEKIDQLYQTIRTRLGKKPGAKAAIEAVEQGQTQDLSAVTQHLQAEMADNPAFADQVRQLAQQIINIEKIDGQNVQTNARDGYQASNNQQVFQGSNVTIYNTPPSN
ncbi:MAG: hypothetical protein ACFE0J_18695 [Elainellaceae cyanobacterium]